MHLINFTHGLHSELTLLNALAEGAPQTSYKANIQHSEDTIQTSLIIYSTK